MSALRRFVPLLCCVAALRAAGADLRIGVIGLDTSHTVSFAKLLNDPANPEHVPGARIVSAWKGGSADVEDSFSRIDRFTDEMERTYGVKLYPTIEEAVRDVDAVMILSVDARQHLEQARRVFPCGKPVFIDKPLAGSLRDGIELFRLARQSHVPCFSASDERFTADMTQLKAAKIGRQLGVFTWGPAVLEPHHPDLFWYGIHAVEKCYTLMGTGCATVVRTHTADTEVVTGVWSDGRVATVRGNRNGLSDRPPAPHTYGAIEFGSKAIAEAKPAAGYQPLVAQIVKFYQTGIAPVSPAETIEILTFMEAADESKRRGGAPVSLAEVLQANGGAEGIGP